MAQTPQQRMANARFARSEEEKRGKQPVQKRQVEKSPISTGWIIFLAVALCGGALIELIRIFF